MLQSAAQDKILQSMGRGQEVTVTNDGATILKALYVDNPAAKVLVGMAIGLLCSMFSSSFVRELPQLDRKLAPEIFAPSY